MPDGTQVTEVTGASSEGFGSAGYQGDTQTEDQVLGISPETETQVEPAVETPTEEQTQTTEQTTEEQPAVTGKPAEQIEPGVIPAELKHLMSDPKIGPKIQSLVDTASAYRQAFPTLREAKEYREAFPTLEEAKAASLKATALDEADDKFYGSPEEQASLAQEWIADNPQAFRSMFVQSAATLQKNDPQGYEQITDSVFQGRLEAAEWPEQFAAMREALRAGDLERLKGLAGWLVQDADKRGIRYEQQTGKIPPEKQALDRDRQAVDTDRAAVRQERIDLFNSQLNASVDSTVRSSIQGTLAGLLKDTAFTDKGKAAIAASIYKELDTRVKADKNLQRQLRDIINPGGKLSLTPDARTKAKDAMVSRAKGLLPTVAKQIIAERTAEVIAQNDATNSKRTAAVARKEVGTAGAAGVVRTRPLTSKDTAGLTDAQIMDL